MKLVKVISEDQQQLRFKGIFECEHCGHNMELEGIERSVWFREILPAIECPICHKTKQAKKD